MEYRESFHSKTSPACSPTEPLQEQEEMIYALSYSTYQQGDYTTASRLFRQLVLTSPFSKDYWKGLASSEQMQAAYEAALHAWGIVSLLDDKDPLPHFHAGECYFFLNNFIEACKALELAELLQEVNITSNPHLAYSIQILKEHIQQCHRPSMQSMQ